MMFSSKPFNFGHCLQGFLLAVSLLGQALGQATSEYTPDGTLETLHGSARLQGVNEIPPTLAEFDSETQAYVTGIVAPSVIMLAFLVFWCCALCCAKPCRCSEKACCTTACVTFFFIASILFSVLGFFIATGGTSQFSNGVVGLTDEVNDIFDYLNGAIDDFNGIAALAAAISVDIGAVEVDCAVIADLAGVDVPFGSLQNLTAEVAENANIGTGEITTLQDQYNNEVRDYIVDYAGQAEGTYVAFTAMMIVFISLFGISALIEAFRKSSKSEIIPEPIYKCNDIVHKIECVLIFTVGLILITLIWIISMLTGPIVTLAADVCVPSVADNTLRIFPEVYASQTRDEFCNDPNDILGPVMCYYLTCEGTNPILAELGLDEALEFVSLPVDTAVAEINTLIDQLNSSEVSDLVGGSIFQSDFETFKAECLSSAQGLVTEFEDVDVVFVKIVETLLCGEITPLYEGIVNDQLCNNIVAGWGLIYIGWTMGAVGFMLTMWFYLLQKIEKERIYMAQVVQNANEKIVGDPHMQTAQVVPVEGQKI